jgi:hypothetical protein
MEHFDETVHRDTKLSVCGYVCSLRVNLIFMQTTVYRSQHSLALLSPYMTKPNVVSPSFSSLEHGPACPYLRHHTSCLDSVSLQRSCRQRRRRLDSNELRCRNYPCPHLVQSGLADDGPSGVDRCVRASDQLNSSNDQPTNPAVSQSRLLLLLLLRC